MSRSLIATVKVLAAGLMMAFAIFVAADQGAASAPAERATHRLHQQITGVQAQPDFFCHHQTPKKHRCQRLPRTVAALLEPAAARKQTDFIETSAILDLEIASRVQETGFDGDGHLRLSFNSVYATTRRMHI